MTPVSTAGQPPGRRGEGSYDERRDQLAESALRTLGELGYARTSLREIAANSPYTHGVVHYYFRDKIGLITYCVRRYKRNCIDRYDDVISESTGPDELISRFADKLVETIREGASTHRVWYDLRAQSMFDERLRPDVLEIDDQLAAMTGRVLVRFAELSGKTLTLAPITAYAMLDGLFERTLLRWLAGEAEVLPELRSATTSLLPSLFAVPPTVPE